MLLRMGNIGSFVWYLDPINDHQTRLIIRMRDRYKWLNPFILPMQLAVDVGDIFFQWKCLQGVKARAELTAKSGPPAPAAAPAHAEAHA